MKASGGHHHRPEAQACAFDRARKQRLAMLALLFREFDDQDRVLCREPDENHHADLRVKIEREASEQDCSERAKHAHRHRKQDRNGYDPALIQSDEE